MYCVYMFTSVLALLFGDAICLFYHSASTTKVVLSVIILAHFSRTSILTLRSTIASCSIIYSLLLSHSYFLYSSLQTQPCLLTCSSVCSV